MRRGFSLLEVIFSMCLLAIVIPLLLNLFPSSLRTLRRSECLQAATTLATYRMDEAGMVMRHPGVDLDLTVSLEPHRYRVVREFYAIDDDRMDCRVTVAPIDEDMAPVSLVSRLLRQSP